MKQLEGFTLLELLVTMSIISVLSAVAIPEFKAYRARAYDLSARLDLRTCALAEEAYFLDFEEYLACAGTTCLELPGVGRLSEGVDLTITTNETDFQGVASHQKGTGATFRWDSAKGGPQGNS